MHFEDEAAALRAIKWLPRGEKRKDVEVKQYRPLRCPRAGVVQSALVDMRSSRAQSLQIA